MKAIEVNGVSKRFNIPCEKTTTLYESIVKTLSGQNRCDEFWALKDITFNVEEGESLGVIGGNGSGKSTLLKLIANILRPTTGKIRVNGPITSFLELGVGFQADLTARENIHLYGKIMGLRSREINSKMEDVIKFSELERFMDTKLRNFSSGMQVRLAFATAIQTDPRILLVDEVLAVGDMGFQQKCFDYFNQYTKEGKTMVFVTHDLTSVRRFCQKTILLRNGEIADYGPTEKVIDTYIYNAQKIEGGKREVGGRWGNKKVIITDVEFMDKFGERQGLFNTGDPISIRVWYETKESIHKPIFGIRIYSENDVYCCGTNTDLKGFSIKNIKGKGYIELVINNLPLTQGKYRVTVAIHSMDHTHYDWINKEFEFNVTSVGTNGNIGLFDFPSFWRLPENVK